MSERLCSCGKAVRAGGRQCSGCYMRAYRTTLRGKMATKAAYRDWRARNGNAEKWDREYKRAWRKKTHQGVPADLKFLRRAIKRLETALAKAGQRDGVGGSGE